MVARLEAMAAAAAQNEPHTGSMRARALRAVAPPVALPDRLRYRSEITRYLLYARW